MDAIEIRVINRRGATFQESFRVKGLTNDKIEKKSVPSLTKKNENFVIKPKDSVRKLIRFLCRKREEWKKAEELIVTTFQGNVGAYQVKDLFPLQREHFHQLKLEKGTIPLQMVWANEAFEAVEKIKGQSEKLEK